MAAIPVTTSDGGVVAAVVDEADHNRLARFRWALLPSGYVARKQRHHGGRRVFYLHREVVGATHGDLLRVEHVNGDKLDNRRSNLLVKAVVAAPYAARPLALTEETWRPDTGAAHATTQRPAIPHARSPHVEGS